MDKVTFEKKKAELVSKQKNTNLIYMSAGLVGGIAGIVYSVKTKRSFWGGVGFFILGSLVVGVPTRLAMIARTNKLEQDAKSLDAEYSGNVGVSKSKDMATSQQFDDLVNTAKSVGADTFDGLSSAQLASLKDRFTKNFTSSGAKEFASLFKKGEKNWTASDKIYFSKLFMLLTGKKLVS